MKKIHIIILVTIAAICFNSCSEIFDCFASTKPELESKILLTGIQGTSYEDSIKASVKNTSNDNSFYYYFSIEGNFPPGLDYSENGRNFRIHGTPVQVGTYTFKVIVTIEYMESDDPDSGFWEDNNRICFGNDTVTKNYTITIQ